MKRTWNVLSFCYLTYNHLGNSLLHISFICLTRKKITWWTIPQIAEKSSPASSIGLKKSLVLMQPLGCLKPLHLCFLSPTWGNPPVLFAVAELDSRFSGWWFQSIRKILVKLGSSSPNRDEHRKYLWCLKPLHLLSNLRKSKWWKDFSFQTSKIFKKPPPGYRKQLLNFQPSCEKVSRCFLIGWRLPPGRNRKSWKCLLRCVFSRFHSWGMVVFMNTCLVVEAILYEMEY